MSLFVLFIECSKIENCLFPFLADRPDPLRLPEVLIVIAVILLWCGSIVIFIRHSELLRIRQRDLPYRSSIDLNPMTVVNRTSDLTLQGKSRPSSTSGLTPPPIKQIFPPNKRGEIIETVSLILPPILQKRRHTHAFDCHSLSRSKLSLEKNNDKQQFLHPERTSPDVQRISLTLNPDTIDNRKPKSEDNLSTSKYPICYSANNISKVKISNHDKLSMNRKRCIQESPV